MICGTLVWSCSRVFLQVAITKSNGGIITAVRHYERMFRSIGIGSTILHRGPAKEVLGSEGSVVLDAKQSLSSTWGGLLGPDRKLRSEIRARAGDHTIVAIVHSDLALNAIRRLFPDALIVAPCHSDKSKRKRDAHLVITLNPTQHSLVRNQLKGSSARIAMLGNPYVSDANDQLSNAKRPIRINFCGRFTDTKDPMILLDAGKLLKTRPLPDLRFIGEGPLANSLMAAAQHYPGRVSFTGWLSSPRCLGAPLEMGRIAIPVAGSP